MVSLSRISSTANCWSGLAWSEVPPCGRERSTSITCKTGGGQTLQRLAESLSRAMAGTKPPRYIPRLNCLKFRSSRSLQRPPTPWRSRVDTFEVGRGVHRTRPHQLYDANSSAAVGRPGRSSAPQVVCFEEIGYWTGGGRRTITAQDINPVVLPARRG